jgi:hypothetical protein
MKENKLNKDIKELLFSGTVIPAHPLALTRDLRIDEQRQRALTRYYIDCGVGGIAIGVHTTQFEIRNPGVNLLEPVLKLAAEEIAEAGLNRPFIKVAGICGPTSQAVKEAEIAVKHGYDLGLVSMGGLNAWSNAELIKRMYAIAEVIPVFGFYLQPAVGGRLLSYEFWREFVEIPNVQAIKVAAFNRYQTLDVVRAVCNSSRRDEIALYTGNDDNIIADLLIPYKFEINGNVVEKRFVGGLLGHWAVWTKKAVELFDQVKWCIDNGNIGITELLQTGIEVTDMNAAIFDPQHSFKGSIAGIHEVLRRQGIFEGLWCINPEEKLSEGQIEEIDRVCRDYPHLIDDQFVKDYLSKRLSQPI